MWFELQARFDPEIHDTMRTPTLLVVIFPALTSSVREPHHSSFPCSVESTAADLASHPCTPAPRGRENISAPCAQALSVVHSDWNWLELHVCHPYPVTKWGM